MGKFIVKDQIKEAGLCVKFKKKKNILLLSLYEGVRSEFAVFESNHMTYI